MRPGGHRAQHTNDYFPFLLSSVDLGGRSPVLRDQPSSSHQLFTAQQTFIPPTDSHAQTPDPQLLAAPERKHKHSHVAGLADPPPTSFNANLASRTVSDDLLAADHQYWSAPITAVVFNLLTSVLTHMYLHEVSHLEHIK